MLPLAAFCWAALALSAVDVVLAAVPVRSATAARRVLIVVAVVIAAAQTVRTTAVADSPPLPQQEYATGVSSVLRQLLPQLNGNEAVRVEGAGDTLNEPWVGVLYGISQRDRDFYTSDGAAGQKWGREHAWQGQPVHFVLTVAVTVQENYQDAFARCQSDTREKRVALYDRLTPANRLELLSLLAENYAARGHLSKALESRLGSLNRNVFRIGVFEGSQPCGS